MLTINGSYLEGGGQIIRTSLALATLSGTSIKIKNIRKGRKKPGLKNQHMFALQALQELCNAEVKGGELGSKTLTYKPGRLKYKSLNIDIKTAGSITLLMQALFPVVLFSDKKIRIQIKGGTDTKFSQPINYFMDVFIPHLRKYADIEYELEKRGYYPKGGGKFIIRIKPKYSIKDHKTFIDFIDFLRKEENKIELVKQGKLLVIKGISNASKDLMKPKVAERQAKYAKYLLNKFGPVKIDINYSDSLSTGSAIVLWALYSVKKDYDLVNPVILGSDALGKKGKRAEKVGEEAAKRLIKQINSEAAVDKYLADQLLLYMALFGGKIKSSEITDHTKTNKYIIEKFLDVKFKIKNNIISC